MDMDSQFVQVLECPSFTAVLLLAGMFSALLRKI